MFEIRKGENGSWALCGRLDAARAEALLDEFASIPPSCVIDLRDLEYISSAGLGLLFAAHKRLSDTGGGLRLVNLRPHIRELFAIAGFDKIFALE